MASYVDIYADYTKSRLSQSKQKIAAGLNPEPVLSVCVNSGLHSSEKAQIKTRNFTIGGNPSDELMLLDDCMEGHCVQVETQTIFLGQLIKFRTDRDDVEVNGTVVVEDSEPYKLPCVLKIGNVELSLSTSEQIGSYSSNGFRNVSAYGFFFISLCAFVLSNISLTYGSTPTVSLDLKANERIQSTLPINTAALNEFLNDAMDNSGLTEFLTASIMDDSIVKIQGDVPAERMEEWHKLRDQFDTELPDGVVLANVKSARILNNLPGVMTVVLGESPRMFFTNGGSAQVGDYMLDEWLITGISAEGFLLNRNDETVVINF